MGGVAPRILDRKWRLGFTSSENACVVGLDPTTMDHYHGLSAITRIERYPRERVPRGSGRA
jgi:hypothetical protein